MPLNLTDEEKSWITERHNTMVRLSEESGPAKMLAESIDFNTAISVAVFRCECERGPRPNAECSGYLVGIADFYLNTRLQAPLSRELMQSMVAAFTKELAQ